MKLIELDLTPVEKITTKYIYYIYYKDKIIYVGKTVNVSQRIGGHRSDKPFDKVLYKEVISDEDFEEAKEILTYYPILNKQYIYPEDHLKDECEMFFELGDYYFIRNAGAYKKEHCFLKEYNLLVAEVSKYDYISSYFYYDIKKGTFSKSISLTKSSIEYGTNYFFNLKYNPEFHTLEEINNPIDRVVHKQNMNPIKTENQVKLIRAKVFAEKEIK